MGGDAHIKTKVTVLLVLILGQLARALGESILSNYLRDYSNDRFRRIYFYFGVGIGSSDCLNGDSTLTYRLLLGLGITWNINRIRVLVGDEVLVELTPYDLTKGRITYRFK